MGDGPIKVPPDRTWAFEQLWRTILEKYSLGIAEKCGDGRPLFFNGTIFNSTNQDGA